MPLKILPKAHPKTGRSIRKLPKPHTKTGRSIRNVPKTHTKTGRSIRTLPKPHTKTGRSIRNVPKTHVKTCRYIRNVQKPHTKTRRCFLKVWNRPSPLFLGQMRLQYPRSGRERNIRNSVHRFLEAEAKLTSAPTARRGRRFGPRDLSDSDLAHD